MIPFICKYCGRDTSEIEYDYLNGYDHLECALQSESEQKANQNPVEKCVLCGDDTQYHFSDHIDMRVGYIEGAGQLCTKCWNKGTDRRLLTIPMNIVYDTPNDQELGYKVRQLYNENNS